jgi:hypothetical protein
MSQALCWPEAEKIIFAASNKGFAARQVIHKIIRQRRKGRPLWIFGRAVKKASTAKRQKSWPQLSRRTDKRSPMKPGIDADAFPTQTRPHRIK